MDEFSTFSVLAETYRVLGRSFGAFLRRAAAAILITAAAIFLAFQSGPQTASAEIIAIAAMAVFAVLSLAHFAVGWHRYVLRPQIEPAAGAARLALSLAYLATGLSIIVGFLIPLIGAALIVVMLGATAIAPSLTAAAFLCLAISGKLALALPAAAIGRRHPLRLGRGLSAGLAPQLLLLLLLTAAPFLFGAGGLALLAAAIDPPAILMGILAAGMAALILAGAATAAAGLSFAFRWRAKLQDSSWWRHH